MKLIIVDEQGKRDLIVGAKNIRESFAKRPFLHLVFNKQKWIITFCSISKKFFVMDKEVFDLFGESFLARNRRLPFLKILPYFQFIFPVITSKCNLACSYCFGRGGKRKGTTSSWVVLKGVVDYLSKQKKPVFVSFISAGEQTSNFSLFKKTVDYLKRKLDIRRIVVSTNGTENPNKYLQVIDKFDNFQISFDGLPEIQDRQRPLRGGGRSSIMVERTIKKLIEKNKKFTVKVVVSNLHKGKEEHLFRYFYDLGIEKIVLGAVVPLGSGEDYLEKRIKKQSLVSLMASLVRTELKVRELFNSFGLKSSLVLEFSFGKKKTPHCALGHSFTVGTDGIVSTCGMYSDKDDLNTHKGMEEFLIGRFNYQRKRFEIDEKKVKKLRNLHKKYKCSDCDFKLCWGGCPLANLRENKDITIPNKKICITRKKQTYELLKSFVEDRVIKIKPCLTERNKKLFYSMQFNEFKLDKLDKNNSQNVSKKSFFIRFNPVKQNLNVLSKKIIFLSKFLSKKNKKKIALFLLSPIISGRLNLQSSVMFKKLLFDLRKNKVLFKITKPIKITNTTLEKEDEFYKDFLIPKTCFECLEMFKVKNNRIEFCNGAKGPQINKVFDRDEIYSIFENMRDKKCYNSNK